MTRLKLAALPRQLLDRLLLLPRCPCGRVGLDQSFKPSIAGPRSQSLLQDLNGSLEIPLLGSSLKTLVDQHSFSFAGFWRATPSLPVRLDDELRNWIKRIFLQFREIELWLMCEEILSSLK